MTLLEAKDRVRIPDLWREFGYEGEPRKTCFCPFHKNTRTPAFSVFDDGKAWKCHAGCGGGSVIDFIARAKALSDEDACIEIIKRAEGTSELPRRERTIQPEPHLPPAIPYSEAFAQRVADSRRLQIAAVKFAAIWMKTLVFARVCEEECWILTDASNRCAEARRIDGKPFPATATLGERKSHSLRGSSKSWPVGLLPPAFEESWLKEHVRKILLVEGGPDYLAACQLIAAQDENVLPVAMLGASATICQDALPYFANRRVPVAAHPDEAGQPAAARWMKQIQAAGGLVRIFKLTKGDLCDIIAAGANHDDLHLF
jgi:DNA primase